MTAPLSDPDRLYDLVPVTYRLQDADRGWPLRALLRVIAEQFDVVEQDIAQLYDNWFVETCEPWLLPYIGALVGFTPAGGADAPISRAEVANTIRLRRRKGTLSALADVASAAGGWPVRTIERYRQLAVTQSINHLHMDRGQTAELRNADALSLIGTPFDRTARNVDVRRANSARAVGLGNIPDVTAFLWRLQARTVTASPAYCYEEEASNCYLFDALGRNTQLVQHAPPTSAAILPLAISRFALERQESSPPLGEIASGIPFLYGADKSFAIAVGNPPAPVAPERIVAANLDGWAYRPLPGQVAVDPELGRIMFPPNEVRRQAVTVSYAHAAITAIGGGEYPRSLHAPASAIVYAVGLVDSFPYHRIGDALAAWQKDAPVAAIIEIGDSGVYSEPLAVTLAAGQSLQLRAASGCRPVLRLLDWQADAPDVVAISGVRGSWFTLDGLTVTGRGLEIGGEISGVLIRHSTLVPGWGLTCLCDPKRPGEPSIEVVGAPLCVTIEHSIVGAIRVERDQAAEDPLLLRASDSIIDATGPDRVAIGASAKLCADTRLTLRRCTVIGQVQTHILDLAENTITDGEVLACRRQVGCVRFCSLPASSRTPSQYECTDARPDFDSRRYGTPVYLRLAASCAVDISQGAEDRSEMGAYHDLMQPQRLAAVRQRLAEYSPASINAGVVLTS